MCIKQEAHMFNVWIIIMQSLNIKEWKMLGVSDYTIQATPKHFEWKKCRKKFNTRQ